jgi:hypothetical protein
MATTQVLLWLQEDTAAALRAHAAMRGGKGALSTVADELLRSGLGLMSERDADTTALPAIEAVVRRVVAGQAQADAERARADTERLASLIVKAIREASVGRWLTLGLIERVRGRGIADEERERAFTAAAGVLRGRLDSEGWAAGERGTEG